MQKEVKIAMLEHDVSMNQLAEAVGRTANYVSKVIAGHIQGIPTRLKICIFLEKEYSELWGG